MASRKDFQSSSHNRGIILAFAYWGTNGNHKTLRIANNSQDLNEVFSSFIRDYFYSNPFGVELWHLFSAPAIQLHTSCYSASVLLHDKLSHGCWCVLPNVLKSVKVSSFLTGLWLCDLTVLHEGERIRTTVCV